KHFKKRLDDILPENQRNDKRAYDLASEKIYDKMLQYLSEDKIKRVKTYSANKLSKLTDVQIDTIKKHFIAIPHDLKSHTHITEVSTPIVSHLKEASLETVSANNISRETKIPSTPQHANLIDLPSFQTEKIRSRLYRAYTEETGLDPWIKSEASESSQSENADNHIIQDSSLETQVMAPNKNHLYQYAIKHGINPKEFSIITEAEKNRWTMGCFRGNLERDIRLYHGAIERKEDPRKYRRFLTDRDRLIGEELL
ncbi:1596_t:CDS:2, partial [Ambispora gerdemannii]